MKNSTSTKQQQKDPIIKFIVKKLGKGKIELTSLEEDIFKGKCELSCKSLLYDGLKNGQVLEFAHYQLTKHIEKQKMLSSLALSYEKYTKPSDVFNDLINKYGEYNEQ